MLLPWVALALGVVGGIAVLIYDGIHWLDERAMRKRRSQTTSGSWHMRV